MFSSTRSVRNACALLAITLLGISGAGVTRLGAQAATAAILGTVTDASGAAIPEAAVQVKNTGTGATQSTTSDAQGRFRVSELLVGNYDIQATKMGFSTVVHNGITLNVGSQTVVDFSLPIGQQTQTVTVEGQVSQVETTNATVGTLTDQRQIRELPLNGRNFEQLILLTPGVQSVTAFTASGFQGRANQYSVAGSRPTGQAILLDDENLQNFWNKGMGSVTGSSLGVEAIGEFQTLTNTYGAQFGGNGAVINSVSRSGTNAFHGSLYEFLRNDKLDAFDTFAKQAATPVKPALRQNQFGGSLGGPVKKDKLFFFGNYEGIRRSLGVVKVANVPACNLPGVCTPSFARATNPATYDAIVNTLALYPLPDAGTISGSIGRATRVATQTADENYGLGRFDYNLSDKDSIFGRMVVDKTNFVEPFGGGGFGGGQVLGWAEGDTSDSFFNTVEWRRIVSPTLVSVARISYSRTSTIAATIQSTPVLQQAFPGAGRQDTQVTITGLSGIGGATQLPFNEVQNRYTEGDDVTWTHGAHTVKLGGSVSRLQTNTFMPFRQGSVWGFQGLAQFLGGGVTAQSGVGTLSFTPLVIPAGLAGAGPAYANRDFRDLEFMPYVQDDWKISSKLTLNLGLRWEFITNPVDAHNRLYAITNFATATDFTNVPNVMQNNPNWKNFDPRIGFAYDPFADHKTSIRGGVGIFRDLILPPNYAPAYWDQPPWTTFQAGLTINPAAVPVYPNIPTSGRALLTSSPGWDYHNDEVPYVVQYNLNIQRELMPGTIFTLGYVGSRGVHLMTQVEQNPLRLINGVFGTINSTGTSVSPNPRLNPALGSFPDMIPTTLSRYNSLQTNVTRRFSRNVQAQASYTWSRCIDDGAYLGSFNSNNAGPWSNPFNQGYDKGPCSYDITHALRVSGLVALPFHGNPLIEGWQVSGVVAATSGTAVTILDGVDTIGFGTGAVQPRPNMNAGYTNNPVVGTAAQWYNAAAFSPAAIGTFGTLGRNTVRGPRFTNADLALTKDTKIRKISETFGVQFRAEFFNIFNHANYAIPVNTLYTGLTTNAIQNGVATIPIPGSIARAIPNPNAGRIQSIVGTPRQIQFALRINF